MPIKRCMTDLVKFLKWNQKPKVSLSAVAFIAREHGSVWQRVLVPVAGLRPHAVGWVLKSNMCANTIYLIAVLN